MEFLDFPSLSSNNGRGPIHTGIELIDPQTAYGEQGFTIMDQDMSDIPLYQKGRIFHTGIEGI